MAGPTVTLTFSGDADKLNQAMDSVGSSVKEMSSKVGSASDEFSRTGRSMEDFQDSSDAAESRAQGFTDIVSGLRDGLSALGDSSLSTGEKLQAFGGAAADLAGGFTNFLIPAVAGLWRRVLATRAGILLTTAATTVWAAVTKAAAVAMRLFNAVLRANPIILIVSLIAVLVAAFIALWNKSAAFRNFFISVWNSIRNVVGSVVRWIRDRWNGLMDFFRRIPERIGGFFSRLGDIIRNAFKGAINGVIGFLNGAIDVINGLIHGINNVSGIVGIPAIPDIPHIPTLHTGGTVPGSPGTEQLVLARAGERVLAKGGGAGAGGATLHLSGDVDSALATVIMALVRKGDIVLAAGGSAVEAA